MKKRYWVGIGAVALGVAGAAYAATISNLSGQSCGADTGNWHFVNNQTGGATGTLDVCFTTGCTYGVQPSATNKSNVHFNVIASGTLVSASTTLPGKLVLSDFTCTSKCEGDKCEPPPCDPKKEICK